ncbi:hypothetical protein ALC53_00610 [Atta colombica]|uniref:Uncharacterized protein n=1 Tax=Atta colombica TaxID=520822 RepID=A0A151I607_9HYME|nr:hypothetical protein ALC53_00610 [Atta colombica]
MSNTDKEVRRNEKAEEVIDEIEKDESAKSASNLSKEARESLCLRAESVDSADVALHPILVKEWANSMHKGLYEVEEENEKKREEEENKQHEVIMKFLKKLWISIM